jgi:hypothetical protein
VELLFGSSTFLLYIRLVIEREMKRIIVTQNEIKMATRPNVYRNRKKYTRKEKHKNFEK